MFPVTVTYPEQLATHLAAVQGGHLIVFAGGGGEDAHLIDASVIAGSHRPNGGSRYNDTLKACLPDDRTVAIPFKASAGSEGRVWYERDDPYLESLAGSLNPATVITQLILSAIRAGWGGGPEWYDHCSGLNADFPLFAWANGVTLSAVNAGKVAESAEPTDGSSGDREGKTRPQRDNDPSAIVTGPKQGDAPADVEYKDESPIAGDESMGGYLPDDDRR